MNSVPYEYEETFPLLFTNNSEITGAESKKRERYLVTIDELLQKNPHVSSYAPVIQISLCFTPLTGSVYPITKTRALAHPVTPITGSDSSVSNIFESGKL